MDFEYDFIIVGGGMFGLVVVVWFIEDLNILVFVVEVGIEYINDLCIWILVFWFFVLGLFDFDWVYKIVF